MHREPELLLEAPGEIPIVIEHKSIVWPSDYLSDHRNEHHLQECISGLLGDVFNDSLYQLTVHEEFLKGKKNREVREIAKQIACVVQASQSEAKSQYGIDGHHPIPWRFRPLSRFERDETMPATGVGTSVLGETWGIWSEDHSDIPQEREIVKSGYAGAFDKALTNAAEKFTKYADCTKILLVQFFGNRTSLWDEDIIEIVQSADMPDIVDQVWIAQEDWIGPNDYKIVWKRVR